MITTLLIVLLAAALFYIHTMRRRHIADALLIEQALAESEIKFRSLVESEGDAIFLADVSTGYLIDCNKKAEEITGYSREEIIKMHQSQLHPQELTEEYKEQFINQIATGEEVGEDLLLTCKDGSSIPVDIRSTVFQLKGREVVLGIFRDITSEKLARQAIKESEERYRFIFENAPIAMGITNRKGKMILFNDTVIKDLGYTKEELLNLDAKNIHTDPQTRERLFQRLHEEGFVRNFYLKIERKNGEIFDAKISATLCKYRGEEVVLSVAEDLSHYSKSDVERNIYKNRVEQTEKFTSLGLLAGSMAHDFNNLMMGILGSALLAKDEIPPGGSAVKQRIADMEMAAKKAVDLCSQMLEYSGRGKLSFEPVDLNELILKMDKLLFASISKNASIEYKLSENTPLIKGDATRIRQIIMNLVINASEAIRGSGVHITISTGVKRFDSIYLSESYLVDELPEGHYVYLEVVDTGVGMDKERLNRLFDPFFTTKSTGRGLGMSAVLGIVRGHKGTLTVDSKPGSGATFTLLFPVPETPIVMKPEGRVESLDDSFETGLVLLVDDEEIVLKTARKMLEKMGFSVITAVNGEDAIKKFREHADTIKLVFLDLTMPVMDGEECFGNLQTINNKIPIIVVSGYFEQEVTERFEGVGLAGFLQKPYMISSVKDLISRIERKKRST